MSAKATESTKSTKPPEDQAIRDRIGTVVDKTLFVEAGAGTGKTTSLVARIMSLITGPESVPINQIAAITFTEKAATELRNRIRAEINQRLTQIKAAAGSKVVNSAAATTTKHLSSTLDGLDGAAISTLHGFARRLLDEHPLEIGLPPSFEVLDEITSQVMFDESWNDFADRMLTDGSNRDWLLKLDLLGVSINHMQAVALKFTNNWDLLSWPPHSAPNAGDEQMQLGMEIAVEAQQLYELHSDCADPEDRLYQRFEVLPLLIERLETCKTDVDLLAVLANERFRISGVGNTGNQNNWSDVKSVREQFKNFGESCEQFLTLVAHEATNSCVRQLRRFALQLAEDRRRAGRLSFQDLLAVCRNLLRSEKHGVAVREALHNRYTHLLLDEFHDTDPIQIEIAALIAAAPTKNNFPGDWSELETRPGHLFFVGDPKQSIYRFRRADIALYHRARERFGSVLGETLSLSVNFRSSKPIIDWVNHTFETLMDTDEDDIGGDVHGDVDVGELQASYAPLRAVRSAPTVGHPVTFLGIPGWPTRKMAEIRMNEAKDVAGAIVTICSQGWTVFDKRIGKERPAHLDDIAILIPSRTSLPYLEDELEKRRIPYRLESTSFVWGNRVIRDLMMCLRAISDPTNELAIVSALRSPIYGCGDDDLFRHKAVNNGKWDYRLASNTQASNTGASNAQTGDTQIVVDPVAVGLAHLNELHGSASYQTPSELIEQLVVERQVLEQATAWPGVREQWRHVRFLVDQARAWSESQQSGLRRFLLWADEQSNDNARVTIPVLPELDGEAVHVMTMHASKGLEFPIVILAGLQETVRKESQAGSVGFISENKPPAVRLRGSAKTSNYEEWAAVEIIANHYERVRRLYVACTRARDHLLVSLHRKEGDNPKSLPAHSSSLLLFDANTDVLEGDVSTPTDVAVADEDFSHAGDLPEEFLATTVRSTSRPAQNEWELDHERALAASKRPAWLSASNVAKRFGPATRVPADERDDERAKETQAEIHDGLEKGEDESGDRAPHASHYGGASFGSAVHGVLERLDLLEAVNAVAGTASGDGAGIDASDFDNKLTKLVELVLSSPGAEGAHDLRSGVEQSVRAVLADPTVANAARSRHWQEIYVGTLAEEVVVDGFIDLLYEDPVSSTADSPVYVVLDFKTSSTTDETRLAERTAGYLPQGSIYAHCVQRVTGATVSRVEFVYVTRDGIQVHTVESEALATAIEDAMRMAQEAASG